MSAEIYDPPSTTWSELDRWKAIESYDILDTPREEDYDDIVKLAATICNMPVSLVTLVAEGRQWFKAGVGLDVRETSLDISICKHAILQSGLFVVPDLTKDPRFSGSRFPGLSGGPAYRFYAGALLQTPDGIPIGTLCVLDFKPRELTENEAFALKTLARQVMLQLELRRSLRIKNKSDEEAKIRKEELNSIVNSSLDGIIVFKAVRDEGGFLKDLRFTTINSAAEKSMRQDARELLGQNLLEKFPSTMSAGIFEKYKGIIEGGVPLDFEYLEDSEQPPRWFRIAGVKLDDGLVVTYNEITERKKAAATLRSNEERLRLYIDAVEDYALLMLDPGGTIITWNAGAERIKGYTAEEIIGQNFSCFYEPEAIEKGHPKEVLRLAAEDGRHAEEGWRLRKDGSRFLAAVVVTAIHDDMGQMLGFAKVTRDITKVRQMEDSLRTSARRLSLATEALQAGVWDWDLRTDDLNWDDRMHDIYGMDRSVSANYQLWAKTVVPEDLPNREAALQKVIASKSQGSAEFRITLPSGEVRYIQAAEGVVLDDAGKVTSVVGVNIDVTARKKWEQQLLQAQRVESIGTLAGGIAHDLNNILAPIMMSIRYLKDTAHDAETKDILETIEESAKRGADIVRQVLSFARGVDGEKIEVRADRLLTDLESMVKNTFPKDIRSQFSVPDDVWNISGDPTQIYQVLMNLCLNARDAMPNGGTLAVGIENCALDEQYAAMNLQAKAGRYVKIAVTDTGTGIPPEIIDKVFEPFFTTKDLDKGTGLGLSSAVGIVRSHGGIIKVYSEPGRGATFEVYLPAAEIAFANQVEEVKESALPQGNGETVLLVDDEAAILKITSKTLQVSGYRVLTAVNGANALAVYLGNKVDIAVVLTDMMMPVMDGTATIHALLRINPAVKIIAASGIKANGGVARVADPRVKHFLAKPYTAETLLRTLRAILGEAGKGFD